MPNTALPTRPFGTSAVIQTSNTGSTLGGIIQGSTNTYTFPANTPVGNLYLCTWRGAWSTPGSRYISNGIVPTNCALYSLGGVASIVIAPSDSGISGSTCATFLVMFTIQITAASASFVFNPTETTAPSTFNNASFVVNQIPTNLQ